MPPGQDASRPEAVAKRHALGQRTASENIADLCDSDSFIEYGALAVAAQRSRRSEKDLIRNTPADGMVTGIGSINQTLFGLKHNRAVVMAYDASVLAGTQGMRNHQKTERMLGIALQQKLSVVLFAEGGGGRPGDVDMPIVAGLHVTTFASFARLNGQVPVIGIVAGRCFAGNAALLGCCCRYGRRQKRSCCRPAIPAPRRWPDPDRLPGPRSTRDHWKNAHRRRGRQTGKIVPLAPLRRSGSRYPTGCRQTQTGC